MRIVRVNRKQSIGKGGFAEVYRISPRRVVKAFFGNEFATWGGRHCIELAKRYLRDEIRGSKLSRHALPILEVVWVVGMNARKPKMTTIGAIKRFIPYQCTIEEQDALYDFLKNERAMDLLWDLRDENIRKDSRGRLYVIDTGTEDAMIW